MQGSSWFLVILFSFHGDQQFWEFAIGELLAYFARYMVSI
jgi:hypothetical protein